MGCERCRNSGYIDIRCKCSGMSPNYDCPRCGNSGVSETITCPKCKGMGRIKDNSQLKEDKLCVRLCFGLY